MRLFASNTGSGRGATASETSSRRFNQNAPDDNGPIAERSRRLRAGPQGRHATCPGPQKFTFFDNLSDSSRSDCHFSDTTRACKLHKFPLKMIPAATGVAIDNDQECCDARWSSSSDFRRRTDIRTLQRAATLTLSPEHRAWFQASFSSRHAFACAHEMGDVRWQFWVNSGT